MTRCEACGGVGWQVQQQGQGRGQAGQGWHRLPWQRGLPWSLLQPHLRSLVDQEETTWEEAKYNKARIFTDYIWLHLLPMNTYDIWLWLMTLNTYDIWLNTNIKLIYNDISWLSLCTWINSCNSDSWVILWMKDDESYLVLIHIRQHASFLVTDVRVMIMIHYVSLNAEVAHWPRIWRQETRCLSLAQLARRCCCLRTQKQTSSCWPQAPVLHQCALTWGAVREEIIARFFFYFLLFDGSLYRVGTCVLFDMLDAVWCSLRSFLKNSFVLYGGTPRLLFHDKAGAAADGGRKFKGLAWLFMGA